MGCGVAEVVAVDAVREALPAALGRALDGVGPCVLPLPAGSGDGGVRERLVTALRPDEREPTPGAAAIVATSGSTGEPRGAVLTAAAIRAAVDGLHGRLGGPGRWVLALPAWHVGGLMVLGARARGRGARGVGRSGRPGELGPRAWRLDRRPSTGRVTRQRG